MPPPWPSPQIQPLAPGQGLGGFDDASPFRTISPCNVTFIPDQPESPTVTTECPGTSPPTLAQGFVPPPGKGAPPSTVGGLERLRACNVSDSSMVICSQ